MKRFLISAIFILSSLTLYAQRPAEVTIYTMPGCGRCTYTVNYLKNNNIPYTEYSTSDKDSNMNMWKAIGNSGKPAGRSISMPVVVINEQTYFSIPDLKGFTESIPSLLAAAGKSEPADDKIDPEPEEENEMDAVIPGQTQTMDFFVKNQRFTYSSGSGSSITTGTASVSKINGDEVILDVRSQKKVMINGKYRFSQAPVRKVYTIILKNGVFNYNPQSGIGYTGRVDNAGTRLTMISGSGDESSFTLDVK
jgi:glutaredoxin